MYAILSILENGANKILAFCSRQDAERFRSFVQIYMEESGSRNGYGAYWCFWDAIIIECDDLPEDVVVEIKLNLFKYMLRRILIARTANSQTGLIVSYGISIRNGAILFSMAELPPRQKPQAGDMFRVLITKADESEAAVYEGRVWRDFGDRLDVFSCWDEAGDGQPLPEAKITQVRTSSVMKINDWKKESRVKSK